MCSSAGKRAKPNRSDCIPASKSVAGGRSACGRKARILYAHNVEQSVLRELAKEIEAMAALERKDCKPEERDDCPATEKQDCPKKGKCSDEVQEFCHGGRSWQGRVTIMVMVSVANLKRYMATLPAVDNISFEIKRRNIRLFGTKWSGKNIYDQYVIGLSRPTTGEITVDGIDVKETNEKGTGNHGNRSDESNLYNEMDGFDNLCFCAALYGMRKEEREPKARQLWSSSG